MPKYPEKKLNAMIDIIKDNKIVCDSVMKCEGWEKWERYIPWYITQRFKCCPFCGAELLEVDMKFCPFCGQEVREK